MFVFFRRHQSLALVFIGLVIISFVVFFSAPNPFSAQRSDTGSIDGVPVSRDEFLQARKEARIELLLRYGVWPEEGDSTRQNELERETMSRLFLIRKLKDMKVEVSDKALAEQIANYGFLKDRSRGTFDPQMYDRFVKQTLAARGYTGEDFQRYAEHDAGIEHLIGLAGLTGGLVPPQEAEASFRQEREQVATQVVLFNASNYLAQVKLEPEAVAQFYTNRQAAYRIPEKIQVSYVKFDATNFLGEADHELAKLTNLTQLLDQVYRSRGTNTFKDDAGQILSPEAAKEKIKEQSRNEQALRAARKKANEFANELFDQAAGKPDFLEKLAAAKGYLSGTTEPFSEYETPPGLKAPSSFGQTAFKLNAEESFAGPLTGEDAVYIIAQKNRLPSVVPSLDAVRGNVTDDYLNFQSRELARQAGTNTCTAITNQLAQGKTFEAACADEKIIPKKLPPFSRKTQSLAEAGSEINLSELKSVAFTLPPGKNITFAPTRDGGVLLYLEARVPLPDSELQTDLPEYLAEFRRRRLVAAFNDWFRAEMDQAHVILPGNRKFAE